MKKILFFALVFFSTFVRADNISIENHTSKTIFAGIYYVKATMLVGYSKGPATLQGQVIDIPKKATKSLNRPPKKADYNREIIFSYKKNDLKKRLVGSEYTLAAKTPAGWMHGAKYHVADGDSVLIGYGDVEWKTVHPIIATYDKSVKKVFDGMRDKYKQHKHALERANVRQGFDLADQEEKAIKKRFVLAKQALEKLLGIELADDEVPRIAICMSGGGMRAAMCSYAFVAGLQAIGLEDAILYAAGLSGSTWFLSHYLTLHMSMERYAQEIMKALTEIHVIEAPAIASVMWPKFVFDEPLSIVDVYGVYLANTFFRNVTGKNADVRRQSYTLSQLQRVVENGKWMFPLLTAVEATSKPLTWFTFTPYEVGCESLGFFVPTWSFGRKFSAGKSTNYAPEQRLGFFMGVWGSALSGSLQDMLNAKADKLNTVLRKALHTTLIESGAGDIRMAAVKTFNPTYGMHDIPLKNQQMLTLMDAGYAYTNLPFPPLTNPKRAIDIIIVMDASGNVHAGANELRKAEQDMKAKRMPFPKINYAGITQKTVSVFKDDDPNVPTVIYVPPVKNNKYSKTFDPAAVFKSTYATARFSYSRQAVEQLTGLIKFNVIEAKDLFVQAIKDKIDQKRAKKTAK